MRVHTLVHALLVPRLLRGFRPAGRGFRARAALARCVPRISGGAAGQPREHREALLRLHAWEGEWRPAGRAHEVELCIRTGLVAAAVAAPRQIWARRQRCRTGAALATGRRVKYL